MSPHDGQRRRTARRSGQWTRPRAFRGGHLPLATAAATARSLIAPKDSGSPNAIDGSQNGVAVLSSGGRELLDWCASRSVATTPLTPRITHEGGKKMDLEMLEKLIDLMSKVMDMMGGMQGGGGGAGPLGSLGGGSLGS